MSTLQPTPTPAAPDPVPSTFSAAAPAVYGDDPRLRSAVLATLLSLMPGLGQAYLGYVQQGFVNVLVVGSLIALLSSDIGALTPLVALFLAFFWLYNLVDANRRAILLNQRVLGLAPGELPVEAGPSLRGSVGGGLALVGFGLLLLAHLHFGLSLAWIQRWWPAALIGLGLYLVWKALKPREA